ncbi:MAG TPA: PHP-associated domain-containing protein [Terriglobales bacterium]|nr:PHP-associated domain-containing protein [Terriglobales bacterium]
MTWSTADIHLHTTCSDGRPAPEELAAHLATAPLAVAAVTDHDTIEGALRVEEALAGAGPEIVIGSEVTSADGHVLALFVGRDVPPGRSAAWTVDAIHDQGGLAVAAHPFSLALGVGDLAARLPFDAIEVVNGSPLMEVPNARSIRRLARRGAAVVGGSDAHVLPAVGNVHTVFPGRCAADLRAAMLARLTRPAIRRVAHAAAWPGHLAWLTWLQVRRTTQRSGPVGTPT